MSEKKEKPLKYCVYCGAKAESQVYCPNCGKQIITVKTDQEKFQESQVHEAIPPQHQAKISRKCSGCSSIITSSILEQCPICNAVLEPLPDYQKLSKAQPGFIFTEKKLKSEKELIIKKDIWNFREGIKVFTNSIWIYFIIYLGLLFFIIYQTNPENSGGNGTSEISIYMILLAQIPGIILGIYPLWYILSNKHDYKKLGFSANSNKLILAFVIGVLGGFLLLLINLFSNLINDIFYSFGLTIFDTSVLAAEERRILRQTELFWIIILMILIILQSISTEILFRGVLHNTLIQKFQKNADSLMVKFKVILIVALVYCGVYILFYMILGIILLILNLLFFILLGILYEINRNIYNTIIANIAYDIIIIILILFV